MRAVRLQAIRQAELVPVPEPRVGPGEVSVAVTHCALCRSDAVMWSQGHRDLRLPRVLGHEVAGRLDGQAVVVWPGTTCGCCRHCRDGRENLCEGMAVLGFHRDGGLAARVAVPAEAVLAVPAGLPGDIACLAEPLACGLNALTAAGVTPGDRVLVVGGGPVGLLLALAARHRGAVPAVAESHGERRERGRSFRDAADVTEAPQDAEGFDVAINATSALAGFERALRGVRPGGRLGLFSALRGGEALPTRWLNEVHYRELRLAGAYGCTRSQMREALPVLLEHREAVAQLVDRLAALEQVPELLPQVLAGQWMRCVIAIGESG